MPVRTLIIHGWSDCSESFVAMKEFLVANGVGAVSTIYYADYESRENNLTFHDVVDGLHRQLIDKGFLDPSGAGLADLNIIVHSTGGLVVRHWLWRYYFRDGRQARCPVKKLVMLAPANFGSPLAHKGNSFLGMLSKGRWKVDDFLEVGREILLGLELGSPYQWELAHRDLLAETPHYSADSIQATVLVGAVDYAGLRGFVNKPGTDGTVVIAGTSLDAMKLVLDYSDPGAPHRWTELKPTTEFAFAVLPGYNHGSLVDEIRAGSARPLAGELLLEALAAGDARQFRAFAKRLDALTAQTYAGYRAASDPEQARHGAIYQQFIVRAVDDHDQPARDYTLDVYLTRAPDSGAGMFRAGRMNKREGEFSDRLYKALFGESHAHSQDPSYRRLLVEVAAVKAIIAEAEAALGPVVVSLKLYLSNIDKGISYDNEPLQNIVIYKTGERAEFEFFCENTTTLVEIRVNRNTSYVTVDLAPRKH